MKRQLSICALAVSAVLGFGTGLSAADNQVLRVVPGLPGAPFDVLVDLDLDSSLAQVVSAATRLSFDATKVMVTAVAAGSAVAWQVQYSKIDNTNGKLDAILYDIGGSILDGTGGGTFEVIKVTFAYVGTPCTTGSICFSTDVHPDPAIFPVNQYIHYNPGGGATPVLLPTPGIGCAPLVEGHAFIRGDVNMSGLVSPQDILDLAGFLWLSVPLPDCEAARDVDNSGGLVNITDVLALIQGYFNAPVVVIPAPYPASGVGPTVLPCNVGYVCP